jgi:murein L,D-transpeptidase YcbB/YkuD
MKAYVFFGLAILLMACRSDDHNSNEYVNISRGSSDTLDPEIVAGSFSDQKKLSLDSAGIQLFIRSYPLFTPVEKELIRFYHARGYAYAWHENNKLIEQSNILYNRVLHMEDNGLPLDAPYLDTYSRMMEDPKEHDLTSRELMLTAQYLSFAKRVLNGIPESDSRSVQWYIPRKKTDYTILLEDIIQGKPNAIRNTLYPLYQQLRKELLRYHDVEKKGGWAMIVPDKKSYRPGDSSPVITSIRKRLFMTGEFSGDTTTHVYDRSLLDAVTIFQETHGMVADGLIGKSVISELNVPVRTRIEHIIVNMERCRWLPNQTDDKHIVINIPEFKLFAYEGDSLSFSCKVVVGTETNKTAIFRGDVKYVVFNPYWNVPESIVKKEILPAMSKDNNYLERNDMEWNEGKIRQKPGEQNALGKVKFLFPNVFNIYLHDTPVKSLFSKEKRTFSHGCIRVSEPRKLAVFLLNEQSGWNETTIDEHMEYGPEEYVTLRRPVPVYVVYFTTFVDNAGRINFRKDIYDRDPPLLDMILSK